MEERCEVSRMGWKGPKGWQKVQKEDWGGDRKVGNKENNEKFEG